jgi:hypothetical protein
MNPATIIACDVSTDFAVDHCTATAVKIDARSVVGAIVDYVRAFNQRSAEREIETTAFRRSRKWGWATTVRIYGAVRYCRINLTFHATSMFACPVATYGTALD